jgi:proteic killer suppression protein
VDDLRNPPGNRPGVLRGERKGQTSLRINDQRRICFAWSEGDPLDVEIVDYH